MTLSAQLEAILFQAGEPVSLSRLAKILALKPEAITAAVNQLAKELDNRGLSVIQNGTEVTLSTAPDAANLLTQVTKEELAGPIGKAGLETAAIVLYHGPITRPEIDYIRGVNSSFSLRSLLIRGLIKRGNKPGDARAYVYEPTTDLLALLGVTSRQDLPRYEEITKLTAESLSNSANEQYD